MSCKHQPVITFKMLFMRKPKYVCRNCGADIEMLPKFLMTSRVLNAVFIALLLLKALSGGNDQTNAGWTQLVINLAIMLGIILIYMIIQTLFIRYSQYREVLPEEKAPEEPVKTEEAEEPKPQYTAEQLEIMAMYAELERKAKIEAGVDPDAEPAAAPIAVPEEDTCAHKPVPSWKNYVPSRYDFVCQHCGKKITFPQNAKKQMNMIFLVVMFLILMPSFTNTSIKFWQYGLLTLLVLVIGVIVQIFFVKRVHFILKQPGQK